MFSFVPMIRKSLTIRLDRNYAVIATEYDPDLVKKFKTVTPKKRFFRSADKTWNFIYGVQLNKLLKELSKDYDLVYTGRYTPQYRQWAKEVRQRAKFTCKVCGGRGIIAHHLNSYDTYEDQRTDINNGACVCEICHRLFHKIYGNGHNTREQFQEFLRTIHS